MKSKLHEWFKHIYDKIEPLKTEETIDIIVQVNNYAEQYDLIKDLTLNPSSVTIIQSVYFISKSPYASISITAPYIIYTILIFDSSIT